MRSRECCILSHQQSKVRISCLLSHIVYGSSKGHNEDTEATGSPEEHNEDTEATDGKLGANDFPSTHQEAQDQLVTAMLLSGPNQASIGDQMPGVVYDASHTFRIDTSLTDECRKQMALEIAMDHPIFNSPDIARHFRCVSKHFRDRNVCFHQ